MVHTGFAAFSRQRTSFDGALGAVEYAKLLAKRFGAGITLLHAASPRPMFEPLPLTGISVVETLADESDRRGNRAGIVSGGASLGVIRLRCRARDGKPCDWADDPMELKRLRQWVGDVPLTVRATLLVERGEAAAQVNDYALAHGIDLIVMGVLHKRRDTISVIGSTTAELTRHAPCPVMTVPADLLAIEEPMREHAPREGEKPVAVLC